MKKILCTLLCVALLLTGLAFAEGGKISVSKLAFKEDGQTLFALENIGLALGCGSDGTNSGIHLDITGVGETLVCLSARLTGDGVVLSADGLLSEDFFISSTDIMALVNKFTASIGDAEAEFDPSVIDIQAITNAFNALIGSIGASFTEVTDVEYAGRKLSGSAFTVKNDDLMAFLGTVAAEADKIEQIKPLLKQTGYASLSELVAAIPVDIDIDGKLLGDDSFTAIVLDNVVSTGESDAATIRFAIESEDKGVQDGYGTTDGTVKLVGLTEDGETPFISANYTIGNIEEDFAYIAGELVAEGATVAECAYYTPAASSTGNAEFALNAGDGVLVTVSANDQGFDAVMTANGESVTLSFNETGETSGDLELGVSGSLNATISANVAIEEDDGAWLSAPVQDPINILTITDEQKSACLEEAQTALLPLLLRVIGQEPSLSSLVGGLLGQ